MASGHSWISSRNKRVLPGIIFFCVYNCIVQVFFQVKYEGEKSMNPLVLFKIYFYI